MRLEDELKQEKFADEFEKAAVNILFTGSWLHNLNSTRLKKYDLSPEQYNVLRILKGSKPNKIMLSEISCRMIDRNSNATRLVEKLRQKGLVKREICKQNRRQVDISITKAGLTTLKSIAREEKQWLNQFKKISKADAVTLNRILDKMRDSDK